MLATVVCASAPSRAQDGSPPLPSQDDLEGLLRLYDVPGASLAYLAGCEVAATQQAGAAVLAPYAPVTAETVFEAASLSKPVFAYLVMSLVEEGAIDLDRPLAETFAYARIPDTAAYAAITPRMILSHRTGLPNWADGGPIAFEAAPGTAYTYSGEAFTLLQRFVERETGQTLQELFRARLGTVMPRSTFAGPPVAGTSPARGYPGVLDTAGSVPVEYDGAGGAAAYSLVTTAEDYARFLGHVCRGEGLAAETYAEMLRPQSPVPPEETGMPTSYALGWMIVELGDDTFVAHGGNNHEFRALAGFSPGSGEGFVALTNGVRGQDFLDVFAVPPAPPPAAPSAPEAAFEALWQVYDLNYALFDVKGVDWDAVYRVYRPRVTAATTDDELWGLATEMMGLLNDVHVTLRDGAGERFFRSGGRGLATGPFDDGRFALATVDGAYVAGGLTALPSGHLRYGWLADSLGYLRVERFGDPEAAGAAVDSALAVLGAARGLVVDVRQNGGGDDRAARAIASRFVAGERPFMTVSARKLGLDPPQFTEPLEWRLRPTGGPAFARPVVVLVDSRTISAAENFALAMRAVPHATLLGETTAGAFADAPPLPLPNGWVAGVPVNVMRDPAGRSYEGLGIAPDLYLANDPAEVAAGRDRALETARAFLLAAGE